MGQGTKHLSCKRPEVAQGVWPAWRHTCKRGPGGAGKQHILAVRHLSHNNFKVNNFR